MRKTVVVSFEEEDVKIVHASFKGGSLSIDKTGSVPEAAFDSYLRKEKASDFIVTCSFSDAVHGTLNTPVVKSRYLPSIIESELRKALKVSGFSFIYRNLGERVIENKKVLEIFYYAVKSEEIINIVSRFYEQGKTVRALYPSVFAAAALLNSDHDGEAGMGVYSTGKEKVAFYTKDRQMLFIRAYEAFEPGLTDYDVQNINMTISYCFQNIRISPSSIFLMGSLSEALEINTVPSAPLSCLCKPGDIRCDNGTFMRYLLPIASFFAPATSNILSREFRKVYLLKRYMTHAAKAFAAAAVLIIVLIGFESREVLHIKDSIAAALKSHNDIQSILGEHTRRKDAIREFLPAVSFINKPSADIRRLLVSLGRTDLKGLTLNTIEASAKDRTAFTVTVKGTGHTNTYASLQSSFDSLVTYLKNNRSISVESQTLNVADKSFLIKFKFRRTG